MKHPARCRRNADPRPTSTCQRPKKSKSTIGKRTSALSRMRRRAEEAIGEEAAQRVVAAEHRQLPERHALRAAPWMYSPFRRPANTTWSPKKRAQVAEIDDELRELEVAAEGPVGVQRLQDRPPAAGRAQQVVAVVPHQRESDRHHRAAIDPRQVGEAHRRERDVAVAVAVANADVAHADLEVERQALEQAPAHRDAPADVLDQVGRGGRRTLVVVAEAEELPLRVEESSTPGPSAGGGRRAERASPGRR